MLTRRNTGEEQTVTASSTSAGRSPHRIRIALAALGTLIAVVLSGCAAGPSQGDGSTAGGGGYPVRISGPLGTATITERPVRIVAMDWTDADFALSLGVRPVGIATDPTQPGGLLPWTKAALGKDRPAQFSTVNSDPVERVAALHPDLILATKDYNLSRSYRQLSAIAPVVTYAAAPNSDSWQQDLRRVAQALGSTSRGERVIRATNAELERVKGEHPAFAGKTFAFGVAPSPSGVYVVNSSRDVSAQLLGQLGLTIKPSLLGLPTSSTPGRAQIGYESANELDADVLLVVGSPSGLKAFEANPIVAELLVVQRGAFIPLDYATAEAFGFPSPLSIRWAVDSVAPKIAEALAHR